MKNIHGDFKLVLSGNVMITVATGPWNQECIEKFRKEYFQLVQPLKGQQRADLVILQGESLLIPSAEQRLTKTINKSAEHGLSHVALVVSNAAIRPIAQAQFNKVYQSSGLNIQFFDQQVKALNWLTQQGVNYNESDISATLESYV